MKKKYILKVLSLAVLPLLGACTSPTGGSSLQRQVDTLKIEVANLKDQGVSSQGYGNQGDPGNLRVEIDTLKSDIQRINNNLESASLGSGTLREQLDYIAARLDRLDAKAGLSPMAPLAAGSSVQIPSSPSNDVPFLPDDAPVYGNQVADPYAGSVTSGTVSPPPAVVTAEADPYDVAKSLYDQKKYKEAANKFSDYLASEPKGKMAPAAQFYIGESLYAQKMYPEAILEYQNVIQKYPKSSQVPTSLLKQGLSFQSMSDKDSAKLIYQKIIREYPKSYAAGQAKERLKGL